MSQPPQKKRTHDAVGEDSAAAEARAAQLQLTAPLRTAHSALYVGRFEWAPEERACVEALRPPPHHPIVVYGKPAQPRRRTQFYSDEVKDYAFSGSRAAAEPLPPPLRTLLARVNQLFDDQYNGILLNVYESGTDYIGAHADDESSLGRAGVVMLVLGATRKFRLRHKNAWRDFALDVDLPDGSLAWMQGAFQSEFLHEVPVEKRRPGRRVSLTFRRHVQTKQ